jgi:flagellar biosynthesis component FlhA
MENTTLVKRTLLVCLHVYITNHTKLTKRKTREDTKTKERPQKSKSEQEDVDNITSIEQIDLKNAVAQLKVRASHNIDACNKIKEFKDR